MKNKQSKQAKVSIRAHLPKIQAVLFLMVLVTLCVTAYRHLADARTLPIREVRVEGELRHLAPHRLEKRVVDVATGGFFNVDVSRIQQVLLQEPWVRKVSVRRLWPDTLVVEVSERTAVARWGKLGLIDTDAKVFYPSMDSLPEGLISLNAPEGTGQRVMAHYQQLQHQLGTEGLQLKQLDLSDRGAWSFILDQGVKVVLGRKEFSDRVARFMLVYGQQLRSEFSHISRVDLRYNNGLAVSWASNKETISGKG